MTAISEHEDAPLAFDLYCGLGGWAEGFLSEGYRVVGFDIEAHDYGTGCYPGELVLRDVRSLTGAELVREYGIPAVIVGSSPCQEFSYRAMPWKRAKALPPPYLGMELFQAQFRIQREVNYEIGVLNAQGDCLDCSGTGNFYGNDIDGDFLPCDECDATGKAKKTWVPMVVENVRGAQKWVGRSRWHYGSYFLWGDVPALMPLVLKAQKFNPDGTEHPPGSWFAVADSKNRGSRSDGQKAAVYSDPRRNGGKGSHTTSQHENLRRLYADRDTEGTKQHGSGPIWWRTGNGALPSNSLRRRAAAAAIAKIPFPLAQHIAKVFKPDAG